MAFAFKDVNSRETVFRHETGIHCRGLLINREPYEPFAAGEVGHAPTTMKPGRHSGGGLPEPSSRLDPGRITPANHATLQHRRISAHTRLVVPGRGF